MEFELNTKGKGLFLSTSTIGLILMMALTTLLWWFISPRLHEISGVLAVTVLTGLRVFYFLVLSGIIFIILTCILEKNFLISGFIIRITLQFLFPITILLGRIVGISKDRMRESYVPVNNSFVKAIKKSFNPKDILILLPHCLQNTGCDLRITVNIKNCHDCGRCNIGALVRIATKFGTSIAIATGGTLARRIIIQNKPKFIIAVACQRDLVDGMQDVFPIPVYGVLNLRPEGPCINTMVDTEEIENVIRKVIKIQ